MPHVIYAPHPKGTPDGSVHQKAMTFMTKLFKDDTTPGLHIEPIQNSQDPRVRTGRVDQFWRAVLFKLTPSDGAPHYVYTGVWPHDDAIEIAKKATLKVNPVNGLSELIISTAPAVEEQSPSRDQPVPPDQTEKVEAATAQEPLMARVSPGSTVERLVAEVGLPEDVATALWAATDEDDVLELAQSTAEWQGLAMVELAAGGSIESVKQSLALDDVSVDPEASEDDQLLAAMRHPVGQSQFAWIETDDELKAVVESEDFAAWRVFLHPEQRRYVEKDFNGPFRLSGGAGTGKTVVLLHRARRLHQDDPQARIVLTTYNRTLADALKRDLRLLDPSITIAAKLGEPGVHVAGVDQLAAAVLKGATPGDRDAAVAAVFGQGGNPATGRNNQSQQSWKDALLGQEAKLPTGAATAAFLASEYDLVVLPRHVTTQADYLKVRRPGRGVALGRSQRAAVWTVIEAYRSAGAAQGVVDYSEVFALASALLTANGAAPARADHVLVDEGQDLSPVRWQFLRALVDEVPNDLFIAEDAAQRIYGQRVTLGQYGIKVVGRSRRLSLNYRTTHQVLAFASGVLDGDQLEDSAFDPEQTDGQGGKYRSARSGPVPVRKGVSTLGEQLAEAAALLSQWIDAGVERTTIGVLVRDTRTAEQVVRGLADRGVEARQITTGKAVTTEIQVMTMHRAKGMEFSRVLIFGASSKNLPAAYLVADLDETERAELMQRERSLFYVAATRARDELVVLWDGEPSEFLA